MGSWVDLNSLTVGKKKTCKRLSVQIRERTCTSVKRFFDVCVSLYWMAWTWRCLSQKDQNACFHCPAVGRILIGLCVILSWTNGTWQIVSLRRSWISHSCPVAAIAECSHPAQDHEPQPIPVRTSYMFMESWFDTHSDAPPPIIA